MNLQHKTHSLGKSFFKYACRAIFVIIMVMVLWSLNAEASPAEYEPPPPKTTAQTLMEIGDSCLNRETMVLSVINSEGKKIFLSFMSKFMFASEKSPGGE